LDAEAHSLPPGTHLADELFWLSKHINTGKNVTLPETGKKPQRGSSRWKFPSQECSRESQSWKLRLQHGARIIQFSYSRNALYLEGGNGTAIDKWA